MADRTVRYVLGATVSGFVGPIRAAQGAVRNLNAEVMRNEQAARDVTTGLGLMGAAAVAGAGLAIKTYANFDKQMSSVKATGGATAAELNRLRESAIDAGAKTAFSATEAAAGIENLLKAGVSAQDVLGGGLNGSLALAAAGELQVADAAEIAATALTQFKLGGQDVTHVADLLAAGAGKAQGDVSDMAQALKQGGLVAAQTGLTIEETTGTLAAFASAGLLGSDAGTSLKTMLQRLSAPTKENAALMESLGISAYDAQGNFVGMEALSRQMTVAFGNMTPAARNAALATIFGADAVRAASVVYEQGGEGIRSWISAVDDQGYAAETAAARLDNLQGDLEAFGGAVETAFIRAGSGGNDALRGLVQGATDVVNALGRIDGDVLSGLTLALGAGGVIAIGTAGLGKLVIGINNAKTAMAALGVTSKATGLAVGGVGAAVSIAAVGLTVWAQNAAEAQARTEGYLGTLDELGDRTDTTLEKINTALTTQSQNSWLDNIFGDDPEYLIDRAEKIGLAIEDLQGYVLGESDAVDKVTRATEAYVSKQDDVLTKGDARKAASEYLLGALDAESSSLTEAERAAANKAKADKAAGVATDGLTSSTVGATDASKEYADALDDQWKAQQKAAGIVLDLRSAQSSYQQSLADVTKALKDNGRSLDLTTEAGRANDAALRSLVQDGLDVADSMRESGASAGDLRAHMKTLRKDVIDAAESLGMSKSEAKKFADQLGLIPGRVPVKVVLNDEASAPLAKIRRQIANLPDGKTITIKTDTQITGGSNSRAGGLPWGDGEGAGWTGKTPRGVAQMSQAVHSIDPGSRVTSGYRPGAVTATGYPSYHGLGRAIDIVSPNMGHTFDLLARAFGSKAKELYYTPRGFIRNGHYTNDVAPVTRAMHYSHVHLALAKGGQVTGPGTGTSDEVPIWASNGEHMWTEREVAAAGGHGAMYRLRAAVLRGALKLDPEATYKVGGAIGSAQRSLDAAEARRDAAAKAVQDAREGVQRARRTKKNEKDDRAAEKRLDKAEERLDKRRDEVSKQRERLVNLRLEQTDYGKDLRRGDIMSAVRSGASGAYGVIDDMLGLAKSGDLTKRQSNRLASKAREAETAMRGLYKQIDGVDKKIESAANRVEKLQGVSDAVKSSLMGEQKLSNSIKAGTEGAYRDVTRTNSRGETWTEQMWDPGTKASVTAKGLVADAQGKAAGIKAFAGKLNRLRKAGLSGTVLQEVAELGSQEGGLVADALLKDTKQIASLNQAYKDIAKYSGQAGEYVTDGMYKGGLSAAKGLLQGFKDDKKEYEDQAYNWGVVMANAVSVALTGKKTSLKKRAMGGPMTAGEPYLTGELGPELIIPTRNSYALTADQTRRLAATSTTAPRSVGGGGVSVTYQIENVTTTDVNAAVDRMITKGWDAVNTNGLRSLAQGVG